jgi:hypothetical protein
MTVQIVMVIVTAVKLNSLKQRPSVFRPQFLPLRTIHDINSNPRRAKLYYSSRSQTCKLCISKNHKHLVGYKYHLLFNCSQRNSPQLNRIYVMHVQTVTDGNKIGIQHIIVKLGEGWDVW